MMKNYMYIIMIYKNYIYILVIYIFLLGFMPGRSTIDAIFILKQTIEQYREGQKDICVTFIDLEKAYDRVPREEIWRTMRERLVPEKYVKLVQDM